ncbi:hypothetical protein [Echinicola shivajiensis]|uniref:hypothetical protein n=1 Tax=Echinicola shivajiensis TaxID=1035916 RepID=UPI001BFC4C11|nr:hypothetical protein [Echinicola shivajiensis]
MVRNSLLIAIGVAVLLVGCGKKEKQILQGPTADLELELVDSLVVDELEPLLMDDHLASLGYFMLRNNQSRQPLLVDENGTVIKEYDILNDSPNGIGSYGVGYRLLNDTAWVAQNLMTGYYVFDYQGNKKKSLPAVTEGIFSITINATRTTFHPYSKNGELYVLGEERNAYNHKEVNAEKLGAGFYSQAKTVFNYNIEDVESELITTYPEEWEPRKSGRYVGEASPLVTINRKNKEMALLPSAGNQLFIYDYSGEEPILKDSVKLSHRFRPDLAPDIDLDAERWLDDYPFFTDLRVLDDGYLVGFYTRIPKEILKELRAKSEQYYQLPEFKEASEQYAKPYYMVIKDGKQVGVINELPVHGGINFSDEEGFIYVNDNLDPEVERDYNVFYKLKVK